MIYLDNAATTKPNKNAVDIAKIYLDEKYFNPSGMYRNGFETLKELNAMRSNILKTIADESKFDLIFTSCGTESDNTAIFSSAKRGTIITSIGEHSAVYNAFCELKLRGLNVIFAPLNEDGSVNPEKLYALIDNTVTFVSIMHVNNETGAINDINTIAKNVKKINNKLIFHSDGVQGFGKIPFKLCDEIDLYSVSAHKIGGLKGVGGLFKNKKCKLNAYLIGGGQEKGLRSGTENTFGIKVFEVATLQKYKNIKQDYIKINEFKKYLVDNLDKNYFDVISSENSSPYILTVSAKNLKGEVLMHFVDDCGLIIGTGSACSSNSKNRYSRVILACGIDEKSADGILRISFSSETTQKEIQKACEILNNCAKELTERMA